MNYLTEFNTLTLEAQTQLSSILINYTDFSKQTGLLTQCLVDSDWLIKCELHEIDGLRTLSLLWRFPFAWQVGFNQMQNTLNEIIVRNLNLNTIEWGYQQSIPPFKSTKKINGVKQIIAISSGKGGVGKSSVTANLAASLQKQGAKVGILDADIYGPSIPTMFGTQQAALSSPDGKHMQPIMAHEIATNSIGYLSNDDNAMIWRGPMASKALMQLLEETLWPDLDYLILDMPPGTGDIQITLGQQIPLSGAVIVTTPQDIALIDAKKGVKMFNEVNVPILGVVENMSWHVCENCGHLSSPFGVEGAQKLTEQFNIEILGQIPLDIALRTDLDAGCPTIIARENHPITQIFLNLAAKIGAKNYLKQKKELDNTISINIIE